MVSVSVSMGASTPAELKQRFVEQMGVAKQQNEGVAVIEAAEAYVGQALDAMPATHEASVTVQVFVQLEHREPGAGA